MMYVHVNPGVDSFRDESPGYLRYMHAVLGGTFGRASVPALTLISGLLMVNESLRRPLKQSILGRVSRILVPMAVWNLLIIMVSVAIFEMLSEQTTVYEELQGLSTRRVIYSLILVIDYAGASESLSFLRDIFVCAVLFGAIKWLMQQKVAGPVGLAALWILGVFVQFDPLVYRENILLFYCLGVFIGLRGNEFPIQRVVVVVAAIAAGFSFLVDVGAFGLDQPSGDAANAFYEMVKRVAVSYLVFAASKAIVRRPWFAAPFYRLEPVIFLVFLGHMTVFLLGWGAWQSAIGNSLGFPYIAFYMLAPVLWLLVSPKFDRLIGRLPTGLQIAIRGKASRSV